MRLSFYLTMYLWILWILPASALTTYQSEDTFVQLWQIGEADNDNKEFSLAPDRFHTYDLPGIHIVGMSDPAESWPYILPGRLDLWTSAGPQTFEILFSLKKVNPAGECRLLLDFLDTHSFSPPKILVRINKHSFERQTVKGNNDWLMGAVNDSGREQVVEFRFPAALLKEGENTIQISAIEGSYALWDAVIFEAQEGIQAGVHETHTYIRSITEKQVLLRKGDQLMKPLEFEIIHTGDAREATLEVSGASPRQLSLVPGVQVIEVLHPQIENTKELSIRIVSGQDILSRGTRQISPVRKWEVHLIHQTHLDIGYTHTQEDVLNRQTQYLYQALDLIKKTKAYPEEARFKWHPEGMWAIDEFLHTASAEKKQEFMNAIQDQSIHLDAFYAHLLTGLATGEELIELMQPAKDFENQYGVPVKTAIGSDIPGYSWGLVTAMAKQGIKFLNTAPNNNHRLGHLFKMADRPFYWVAPNGQDKVLTWMASHAYIYFWFNTESLNRVPRYLDYLEKKDFPYDIAMLRYEVGGDNGYPDPELPDKVRSWNEIYAWPKIILSTNSRLYDAFIARYDDEIPILSGDLTPYWEDGATSTSADLSISRQAGERLLQSHALDAMIRPETDLSPEFRKAWNNIIMYDEHTWGAHSSIAEPFGDFTVSQERYKRQFALNADSLTSALTEKILQDSYQSGSGVIDIYNTSSWVRSDLVILRPDQSTAGDRVLDDAGVPVVSQRLAGGELAFQAEHVPAFGARRYRIEKGGAEFRNGINISTDGISNDLLSIRLDRKNGSVGSIVMLGSGRELVDSSEYNLNEYIYIRGRETGKNISGIEGPVTIHIEDAGPLIGTLRIESQAPGCNTLIRRVRLIAGDPSIEIINTVDKKQVLEPEGVYFTFPFNIPEASCRIDIPWGVMRPETDQLAGANRNYYPVQRWLDISNERFGLTWVTVDAPMIKFNPMKIVGKGRGESQFVAEMDESGVRSWWNESINPGQSFYSWVMSNHWETNYKAYQEGPVRYRYVLFPHDGCYSGVEAEKKGREICQPLIALERHKGSGIIKSPFSLDSKQIIVSSVKPAEDGSGLLVRLYNTGPNADKAELKIDQSGIRIQYCDPSGTLIGAADNIIELCGYGVVSLRIDSTADDD